MLIGLNFMGENFGDSEYGYFTYAGITPKTVSDPQILDLYEKGDYAAIYGLGHAMGERSSADAYFALGTLYQLGLGVKKNPKEASRWFEKAAFQDHAPAQYNLGVNYIEQNSDTKLIEAGANWIKIAARQGLVEAVFAMSVLYHHGVGVEKNEAEHAKWLEMAIAKDYARSHTFMADLLCKENMPTGKDDFKLLADVVTYWYEKAPRAATAWRKRVWRACITAARRRRSIIPRHMSSRPWRRPKACPRPCTSALGCCAPAWAAKKTRPRRKSACVRRLGKAMLPRSSIWARPTPKGCWAWSRTTPWAWRGCKRRRSRAIATPCG